MKLFFFSKKLSKGRNKTSVVTEMFKTENIYKTAQVVGAIDGTHDFITAPTSEN